MGLPLKSKVGLRDRAVSPASLPLNRIRARERKERVQNGVTLRVTLAGLRKIWLRQIQGRGLAPYWSEGPQNDLLLSYAEAALPPPDSVRQYA